MDDEYTLCSSSTEQGEISVIDVKRSKKEIPLFPREKSQLRHMYLPGTSLFIGHNTIPRPCDYPSIPLATLKKRLRQDLRYPFICVNMDSDRSFFENGFTLDSEVKMSSKVSLDLVDIKDMMVSHEGMSINHTKNKQSDGYKDMWTEFMSGKRGLKKKNINILIKDSILNNLGSKDIYSHFTVQKKANGLRVIFDRMHIRRIEYHDYLMRYGEEVIKSLKSHETRTYSNQDAMVVVYSSTTFNGSTGIQRLFSGIDVNQSITTVINRESVGIINYSGSLGDELEILFGIEFKEGEYLLNDGKIYRIDPNGEKFMFDGLLCDEF